MVDRLPVVLRTDTTPARLQEMPAGDMLPADVLSNALSLLLQGLVTNNSGAIAISDTVLQALGKLQAQVSLRAPLLSPAFTGTPTVPTATDGTSTTQAASTAFVQGAVGGALSKAVTGGTVTLTAAEASNALITLTGVLTSNLTVVFPAGVRRLWTVMNSTTGAFTATVKLAAGTGTTVTQGKRNLVTTDGTNFYDALDDFHDISIGGNPTTTTQAVADNSTRLATTAFVKSVANQTFASVPGTNQGPVVVVTEPHLRIMVWNGTKYVRAPWHMPGVLFFSYAPAASVTHGIQVRSDVTYNKADHPDLAEILGVSGSTFILPEGRARVLRAADNGRGIDAALVNGYLQEDAIRNIFGIVAQITTNSTVFENAASNGAFYNVDPNYKYSNVESIRVENSANVYPRTIGFDASRQVATATENRVKSLAATLYITK